MKTFFSLAVLLLLVAGSLSRRPHHQPTPENNLEIISTIIAQNLVNGSLNRAGFRNVTARSEALFDLPRSTAQDIEKEFLAADTNNDGVISLAEINAAFNQVKALKRNRQSSPLNEEELALFWGLITDNSVNGVLTYAGFRNVTVFLDNLFNLPVTPEANILKEFGSADSDSNGVLNHAEITAAITRARESPKKYRRSNPIQEIELVIRRIIEENLVNGNLNKASFRNVSIAASKLFNLPQQSDEEINGDFLQADTNSDGLVSQSEISAVFAKSLLAPQKHRVSDPVADLVSNFRRIVNENLVNGALNRNAFRNVTLATQGLQDGPRSTDEEINNEFLQTDTNSDGLLSESEIYSALNRALSPSRKQNKFTFNLKKGSPSQSSSFVASRLSSFRPKRFD